MRPLLLIVFLLGGCSLFRDPRASCNHPKHEDYIREQQAARLARETRSYQKTGKTARRAPKSCPNP